MTSVVAVPASFAQERFWFLEQLAEATAPHNLHLALELTGPLDVPRFGAALQRVVARHESLRTTLRTVGGRVHQVIADTLAVPVPVVEADPGEVAARAAEHARRRFQLSAGPLLRTELLRTAPERHVWLLTLHHAICDGWSLGVLLGELSAAYRGEPLPPLALQYADHALWQRSLAERGELDRSTAYWVESLAGAPRLLELPADRNRPKAPGHHGALLVLDPLPPALADFARAERATAYTAALAAFGLLLHRVTGADDLVVGTTHAGRDRPETEPLIGCFANTLPLRVRTRPRAGFRALLAEVRELVLTAHEHAAVPFDRMVRAVNPDRALGHNPLFQTMLDVEPAAHARLRLPEVEAVPLMVMDRRVSLFDLSLTVAEGDRLVCEYSTELFDEETVRSLTACLPPLLDAALAEPDRPVGELPLLRPAERRRVLAAGATPGARGSAGGVVADIASAAARTPGAVAVLAADGDLLTYAGLAAASARLAAQLTGRGVRRGSLVALCCDRSPAAIVAIHGVLRAGAAYLPIDPDQPAERIAALLHHAAPAAVVTTNRDAPGLPPGALVVDVGESPAPEPATGPDVEPAIGPDDLAYVMFTSGSTGRPKGVEVTHRGLASYTAADRVAYGVTAADRVLQFGSLSFDLSAEEIFPCLAAGATLVLRSAEMLESPAAFLDAVDRLGVTVAHLPTSYLNLLCGAVADDGARVPGSLRLIVIGSEPADPAHVDRWQAAAPGVRLAHAYGVTEASMVSAHALLGPCADRARVTIGRPVAGTELHLLDGELEPVPDGVSGEIHLGGAGLARGYLHDPGATAGRFVPHPFAVGERLYRTGDLARRGADGTLEYIGRVDRQISLRGYRIEPGEPEAALRGHPAVRDVAVTVHADRLVAYLVPAPGTGASTREVRAHAARLLPGHLVPAAYMWLPALPRTGSGKVDLRALPDPAPARVRTPAEPSGDTQCALAEIWREVLAVERVGADDDFFELGGHSLLAAQAAARMRRRFGVAGGIRLIFEHPRLADAADAVDGELAARSRTAADGELAARSRTAAATEITVATAASAGRALAGAVGDGAELDELLRGLGVGGHD